MLSLEVDVRFAPEMLRVQSKKGVTAKHRDEQPPHRSSFSVT